MDEYPAQVCEQLDGFSCCMAELSMISSLRPLEFLAKTNETREDMPNIPATALRQQKQIDSSSSGSKTDQLEVSRWFSRR
jgi:hypothetical protein